MSVAAAQLMMRWCVIVGLLASGCASSPPTASALEVDSSSSSADITTPSILERAQAGLLFVDGGPAGSESADSSDPHVYHRQGSPAAPAASDVDAGTP